ncbi:MAG: hypothetical protein LBT01_01970 [Spirochaetaceae bacterium]|jgi:hypothetical protein|nr:hypothetical protein [Spirochaetaceae bacterium]
MAAITNSKINHERHEQIVTTNRNYAGDRIKNLSTDGHRGKAFSVAGTSADAPVLAAMLLTTHFAVGALARCEPPYLC